MAGPTTDFAHHYLRGRVAGGENRASTETVPDCTR
jgi:hypothetical protein